MEIWRIHIKTDANPGINPSKFCIKHNILAVGWQPDNGYSGMDWESYVKEGEITFKDDLKSWRGAVDPVHNEMKIGDLCWTRDTDGIYYLGKIVGHWEYRVGPKYQDFQDADTANIRECEWKKVGYDDAVPGYFHNAFIPSRTVQRVANDTGKNYSKYFASKFWEEFDFDPSSYWTPDLYSLLSPFDCEDIVGIYLQMKFGCIFISSSCKKGLPNSEYILKTRDGKTVLVQVKQGRSINPDDYSNDLDVTWFLFSTIGEYCGKKSNDRVICLCPKEISEFVFENRKVMPGRIQNYLEFIEEFGRQKS